METLHRSGRREEAAEVARQLPIEGDVPNVLLAVSGALLAQCGGEADARERLSLLEARMEPGDSLPFWRAVIHAGLGEVDRAFALFNEAIETRDGGILYLGVLPPREAFQDDPRFGMLLRRIGLGHLVPVVQERFRGAGA
jgi:hypothetical protein